MIRAKIIFNFIIRDFKIAYSYKTSFIGRVFGLFFLLGIFYYISVNINNENKYFSYLLVGLAYSAIIRTALFYLSNQIAKEQSEGTVGYLFTTPHTVMEYLLGTSASGFILCWIEAAVYILIGVVVFNASLIITVDNFLYIILAILLGTFSMWGLGLISGAVTLWLKKGNSVSWLLTAGIIFAGDVFFPSSLLPGWLRWLSKFNPAMHTLNVLRNLLTGKELNVILEPYLTLLIFSCIFTVVGYLCFNASLKRVKRKGTLEHF